MKKNKPTSYEKKHPTIYEKNKPTRKNVYYKR